MILKQYQIYCKYIVLSIKCHDYQSSYLFLSTQVAYGIPSFSLNFFTKLPSAFDDTGMAITSILLSLVRSPWYAHSVNLSFTRYFSTFSLLCEIINFPFSCSIDSSETRKSTEINVHKNPYESFETWLQ